MSDAPMVLTMTQLKDYAQVGDDTLREWMNRADDPLPHLRLGESKFSHVRFRRDLFDHWFEREIRRQLGTPGPIRMMAR